MSPASNSRRFLLAPDSFKGTFSAAEVAGALAEGVREGGATADLCPLADGGEGTMDALVSARGGEYFEAPAHDPLGRPIEARFARLGGGDTAIVDVAEASGLPLLAPEERDPVVASSAGSGELIAAAVAAGATRILVAAGGSATTDGGAAAIEALEAAGGLDGARIEVLCDVTTPFEDAARVFAPQKGADAETVAELSERLEELAQRLPRDPRGLPMSGCAGGLSGGLWAAFGAELRSGADYVLEIVGFSSRLFAADAVISGEGRLDEQSFEGKVVGTVAELCRQAEKELHLVVGESALDPASYEQHGLRSVTEAQTQAQISVAARQIRA
jgi:glycerate kinase